MTDFHGLDTREFVGEPIQHTRHGNGSMRFVQRVNGRPVRAGYAPGCHVCRQSDEIIREITLLANTGVSAKLIHETINEGLPEDKRFSYQSLCGHLRKHTPDRESVDVAHKAMARAFQEMQDVQRVSPRHTVQLVLEKGFALMANDQVEIKTSDILAAARIQNELDQQTAGSGDAAFYGEALSILLGEIQRIVNEDQFNRLLWSLNSNKRMRQIAQIIQGDAIEAQAVEREQVEQQQAEMREAEHHAVVAEQPSYDELLMNL